MKSRVLRIIVSLVLLLMVLIALLPRIASSAAIRGLVSAKVTEAAPGVVEIGEWRLTWNRGMQIGDLRYRDPGTGVSVDVEQVTLQQGLLGLIRNHRDLGEVRVVGPLVRLEVPDPSTAPPPRGTPSAPAVDSIPEPGAAPRDTGPPEAFQMPDYAVDVELSRGRIEIVMPGQTMTQVVENLEIAIGLAGANQPVSYFVGGGIAGGEGMFSVQGETTLTRDGELIIDQVSTDTRLTVADLDLEPLTTWAGGPVVKSALSLDLQVNGILGSGIGVRGNVRLPDASLSGDALGGDQPRLGDVAVVVNATYANDRVGISNLVVRSSLANLQATGDVGTSADGVFSVDGRVDLAVLAREFPHSLHLQEGVELDEGIVTLAGRVNREQDRTEIDISISMDALKGNRAGEVVSWDAPTRVAIRGRHGPDLLVVDQCSITSPFLKGEASGTLDAIELHVDASLGQALDEAGKFVDLAGWSAAGDLVLELAANKQDDGYQVAASIASPRLSVGRGPDVIAPPEPAQISFSGSLLLPADAGGPSIARSRIDWQSWVGKGFASVEQVEPSAATVRGLHAEGGLALGAVATTLHALGVLPGDVNLGGDAAFEADADIAPGDIAFSGLSVTVSDLTAGNAQGSIREPKVTLGAVGRIQSSAMEFPSITCSLSAGTLSLRDTRIEDGAVATRASGRLALKPLLAAAGDFVPLPAGASVSGTSQFDAAISARSEDYTLSAEAGVTDLQILLAGGEPLQEDRVHIAVAMDMDGATGTLHLSKAAITSEAVQLEAVAESRRREDQHQLSASGKLGLNLAKIASYVRALLGIELEMAGVQTQPFTFASGWQDDDEGGLIRNARLTAGLHADRIEAFGLTVTDLDIPLKLAEGKALLDVKGLVNEGTLSVRPRIDFNQEPAVAMLVDPTNLLTNVQLTDRLSEELLSKIHPLFKGASEVTGQMSMGMEEFVWPLAPEARAAARFNGWMQFTGLHMETHGMVEKILAAMKVRERSAEFGDRDLEFRLANERITCSPLRFQIDKYDVAIVGSMGLDQTLDYSAQIPVTESLVGRDGYKYLEGTTIRVPIRGSSTNPQLNASVLSEATRDLARQAAQKAITENAGRLLEGLLGK